MYGNPHLPWSQTLIWILPYQCCVIWGSESEETSHFWGRSYTSVHIPEMVRSKSPAMKKISTGYSAQHFVSGQTAGFAVDSLTWARRRSAMASPQQWVWKSGIPGSSSCFNLLSQKHPWYLPFSDPFPKKSPRTSIQIHEDLRDAKILWEFAYISMEECRDIIYQRGVGRLAIGYGDWWRRLIFLRWTSMTDRGKKCKSQVWHPSPDDYWVRITGAS